MNAPQAGFIGQSVERREDARFLTGSGQYTDDITLPGQTYGVFLRSPHAHARIKKLDTAAAAKAPGVLGIFTGEHFKARRRPALRLADQQHRRHADEGAASTRCWPTARCATSATASRWSSPRRCEQAEAAAALIEVDYEELPAVVDAAKAGKARRSPVHDDAPDNHCYRWGIGDKDGADAALQERRPRDDAELPQQPADPQRDRAARGQRQLRPGADSYTLYVANQNPHVERLLMCAFVLGIPEHKMRVVAPDVGGGFGSKIFLYGEETALVFGQQADQAADQVDRPNAREAFLSDAHGRDHLTTAELALDKDGKFLALQVDTTANLGAYLSDLRVGGADHPVRHAAGRPVHDAEDLLRGEGGVHQHRAGRRLPRRRPARGHLRRRAHRRDRGHAS